MDTNEKTLFFYPCLVGLLATNRWFSVCQNPVSEEWFVDFTGMDHTEGVKVEIFDLRGHKSLEENASDGRTLRLTRSGFPSGTHILKVSSEGGIFHYQKVAFL